MTRARWTALVVAVVVLAVVVTIAFVWWQVGLILYQGDPGLPS
jgi:hypothetical protein